MFYNKKHEREPVEPELYTEEETDALEKHIERYFGDFESVFRDYVSRDIRVDIAVVEPTAEREYFTLITMGMGAHRMNVPKELSGYGLERAELVVSLPPDWDIQGDDEIWHWPMRWLKKMARLPAEHNTWLGWGHTVPNGGPFAANTEMCCMMLVVPEHFGDSARTCKMPDGSQVVFYQLVPLYEDEMNLKIDKGAEAVLERMGDTAPAVLDISRPSVCGV